MTRKQWFFAGGGLASVAVMVGAFTVCRAEDKPPVDRTKDKVEIGTKKAIVQAQPVPTPEKAKALLDVGKGAIERPTEAVLAKALADAAVKGQADKAFVNPKVAPGKVTWHKDLAAACAASKQTGRPVLLFQMMGKLDDKFC